MCATRFFLLFYCGGIFILPRTILITAIVTKPTLQAFPWPEPRPEQPEPLSLSAIIVVVFRYWWFKSEPKRESGSGDQASGVDGRGLLERKDTVEPEPGNSDLKKKLPNKF